MFYEFCLNEGEDAAEGDWKDLLKLRGSEETLGEFLEKWKKLKMEYNQVTQRFPYPDPNR